MDGNAGDGQDGKKRKSRTSMDLNEIWKLYNETVEINGMSLSMLVRSKQNDRQGGASETTSTWWMKKVMKMSGECFLHPAKQSCLLPSDTIPEIFEICQTWRNHL